MRHCAAVLAYEHEHGAEHHFPAILGRGAGAQLLAFQHLSDVLDAQRHARVCADDNVADFVQGRHLSGCANQVLLAAFLDVARAHVGVIFRQRLHQVMEAQTIRDQLRRVGRDVKLLEVAADGIDVGHAGDVAQVRPYYPILNGA